MQQPQISILTAAVHLNIGNPPTQETLGAFSSFIREFADDPAPAPPTSVNTKSGRERLADNPGAAVVIDHDRSLMWTDTLGDSDVPFDEAVKIRDEANARQHGGFGDWDFASPQDLLSLVDYDRHEPAIDTSLFPDTKSDWYWTNKPAAWSPAVERWIVYFGSGTSNTIRRHLRARVRLVRCVSPSPRQ